MNRTCAQCGRLVPTTEQMYTLRLDMFARAEPLVFSKDDLQKDHSKQLTKLLEKMESMDPQEAADQVHERYEFDLCSNCRDRMHQQLKQRIAAEKPDF